MPAIQGRPSVTVSESLMHVAFVVADGADEGKIIDYYYDDEAGWLVQDVTHRVPGASNAAGTAASITTDAQWHTLYRATGGGLSHLYYRAGDGWFYDDLANLAHARPMAGSASCAMTPGQLHAFYRDDNRHISHTYYRDGGWIWEDMAAVVPGSLRDASGDPAAIYVYDQVHVAYVADDGSLAHFYHENGRGWIRQDMTTPANRAPSAKGAAVFLAYGDRLECFYRDRNDHIARLYFAKGGWQYEDISAASQCSSLAAGDPAAIGYDDRPRIVFRDSTGHVIELTGTSKGDQWSCSDLSKASSAPNAASDPALGIYASQLHVFFAAVDGHIHDIYGEGAVSDQDLDVLAKRPIPIGKMSLHNEGDYLVTMRFNYLKSSGQQRQSPATTGFPFRIGTTSTADPGDFRVNPGDELWIDISAYLGHSAQGHQHFIYSPGDARIARYHCSGATLDVKLVYDGIRGGATVTDASDIAATA